MTILSKLSLLAVLAFGLGGCSVFDDEEIDPDEIPELVEIQSQFTPRINWQAQVGDGVEHHFSRLTPQIDNDVVYAASRQGIVTAFALADGKSLWSVDLRADAESFFSTKLSQKVAGGLTVAYHKLFLGTEHGQVMALSLEDGKLLWSKKVKGEVITPPGTGDGLLYINTAAGYLIALHPDEGEQRWIYEQEVPPLTLRGISTPVSAAGGVVFGSADGKLNVLISQSGLEAWKQSVATAVGASELERLVDVDTKPVLTNDTIYTLAYNGNLVAVDLKRGSIKWKKEYSAYHNMSFDGLTLYLTDESDTVYAVDSADGKLRWKQSALERRGLTGPYASGDYVVVGDSLGVLHWLSKDDGSLVSRLELDDSGFYVAASGSGNQIVVQTRDGEVTSIDIP